MRNAWVVSTSETGQWQRIGVQPGDTAKKLVRQTARLIQANVDTAEAIIVMRKTEVANAQAQLIGFGDQGLAATIGINSVDFKHRETVDGRTLQLVRQSEKNLGGRRFDL